MGVRSPRIVTRLQTEAAFVGLRLPILAGLLQSGLRARNAIRYMPYVMHDPTCVSRVNGPALGLRLPMLQDVAAIWTSTGLYTLHDPFCTCKHV